MIILTISLLLSLIIILIAAEIFTNALEHFGERINISEGVTGSLFAAVGTALPETLVPILAIVAGTQDKAMNEEISIGAILGAPLMLSTLSIFLMGIAAIKSRGIMGYVKPEKSGHIRDLNFFLTAYAIATVSMLIPNPSVIMRGFFSVILISLYALYIIKTVKASKGLVAEGHNTEAHKIMFLNKLGFKDNCLTIILQLLLGLILLVFGAKGFIHCVGDASKLFGISPMLLSLLIIPIATELPEKINSILWVRRGKDTMAVGNITGAMVFQGTLLPALGIFLTPWKLSHDIVPSIVVTILAAVWLKVSFCKSSGIRIISLAVCGLLYVGYLAIVLN